MHGRLKVKTSAEKEAERNVEREKKKLMYQNCMNKIKSLFNSGNRSTELLNLMTKILESIPELATLWNWRKIILLDLFSKCVGKELSDVAVPDVVSDGTDDGVYHKEYEVKVPNKVDLISSEKLFVARCLEMNPKAYSLWSHRRWLVEQNPSDAVVKEELGLCNLFLKYDERNFHCWDYRRFIVEMGEISSESELEVSTALIERNFSNYSAWHYRSTLLDLSDTELVKKELEWTQNAYFTDPSDQSVWLYYQWLLGRDKQTDKLLAVLIDSRNSTIHVLYNNVLYEPPTNLEIYTDSSSLPHVSWTSTSTPARLWSADLETQSEVSVRCGDSEVSVRCGDSEVSVRCGDSEVSVRCGEQTVRVNPSCLIGTSAATISPKTPLTAPPDIVTEQLANIWELYDLEPLNKWVILTLLYMLHATQSLKTKEQISEIRRLTVKLCQVDAMRTGYYRDLWSKILCETAVISWWYNVTRDLDTPSRDTQSDVTRDLDTPSCDTQSDVTRDLDTPSRDTQSDVSSREPLNLSKMYLTHLAHPDFMFALQDLNISHNNITDLSEFSSLVNLQILDVSHNKLTTLEGIEGCKNLVELDASHNAIHNPCTVLPCTKCRLWSLSLTGNPLSASDAYPSCVLESCPMLCQLDGKEL